MDGEEISILVKARYPLIYVVSWEEKRVLNELNTLYPNKIATWSITEGFVHGDTKVENSQDPVAALDFVLNNKDFTLYVLKDFHAFMRDAVVTRKLRDVVNRLTNTQRTAIILSPVLQIPTELQKGVTVVDFVLPDAKQLCNILDKVINSVRGRIREPTKDEKEQLIKACLGLTQIEAENAYAKSIVEHKKLDINSIIREKEQIIRKTGILEFYTTIENFDNIGGIDNLKKWLKERKLAFSDKAKEYGLRSPRGVLLVGVQGCGKSLTAKAIASLWQLPLLRLDAGKLFTKEVGGSEENIRQMVKIAESIAPCIVWVDEIEKGFSGVHSSTYSDAGTTARVFGTFITWLNEKTAPVFLVATANDITQLPAELLRKGRFDEIFFVDLPNEVERAEIIAIHLQKRGRNVKKFQIEQIVKNSEGYSGAEIEEAIISAMYKGFYEDREFTTSDIVEALKETVPLSKTMKERIDELRRWAETRARFATTKKVVGIEEKRVLDLEVDG